MRKNFWILTLLCGWAVGALSGTYQPIPLVRTITTAQPMTGLVFWPDRADELDATHGDCIALEFSYCLPCEVVTGKQNGAIVYDWSSFEALLDDIASRGHQAIVRFRYEYPSSTDIPGAAKGATAVPAYIKAMSGYTETYSKNPGGDGPTYYADWSSTELQWFTKQFYTDFAALYGSDPRIAFLEVGFGHWSEYHIYGTRLNLGVNFPSKAYQASFFQHMDTIMPIPWLVSIDAADDEYSPVVETPALMACRFGLFDDSFMHEDHEIGSNDGYNEECWNLIGCGTRWHTGACGGEISYYEDSDQHNFLCPTGMYGVTWEQASAKYHITFMIANDAPDGVYATPQRVHQASLACGYRFRVTEYCSDGDSTRVTITNEGIAPLYRDAYLQLGSVQSDRSLRGLLPGQSCTVTLAGNGQAETLSIVSPHILTTQQIGYEANLQGACTGMVEAPRQAPSPVKRLVRGLIHIGDYLLDGRLSR